MMRFLAVQYAGDFREAYQQLQANGTESYYGHRYILEQLSDIGRQFGSAGILCCMSNETYVETLPNGVTAIGAGANPRYHSRAIIRMIEEYNPTHLVALGPLMPVIKWSVRSGRKTLCMFADSFEGDPIRRFLRYGRIATKLNDPRIDWVANHGVNACRSLARIGVDPAKVIPWDFVHERQPIHSPVKQAIDPSRLSLMFVGLIHKTKGVGDIINAVAALKRNGLSPMLRIAGAGDVDMFKKLSNELGVADNVQFLGRIANTQVVALMRESSIVVVPSRHEYPEGLPLTIYEALSARTPIVASDHPMFKGRLTDRENAMIFPAGDHEALARCIETLTNDPSLYHSLSAASQHAWEELQIPMKWGDLLHRWIGSGERAQDLPGFTLASGRYD